MQRSVSRRRRAAGATFASALGLLAYAGGCLIAGAPVASASVTPAPLLGASERGAIPGEYVVVLKEPSQLRAEGLRGQATGLGGRSATERVTLAANRGRRAGAVVTQQYTHALHGYAADAAKTAVDEYLLPRL
jgi:hypothetical protein